MQALAHWSRKAPPDVEPRTWRKYIKEIHQEVLRPARLASQGMTSVASIRKSWVTCWAGLYICYVPLTVICFPCSLLLNETFFFFFRINCFYPNFFPLYTNTLEILEEDDVSLIYRLRNDKEPNLEVIKRLPKEPRLHTKPSNWM